MNPTTNGPQDSESVMPSLFPTLRSTINKPLISQQELERLIKYDPIIKGQTIAYQQMKLIDRKRAENMKRNSQAICPSIQFRRAGRKLEDFGRETFWMMLDYDDVCGKQQHIPPKKIADKLDLLIAQVEADPLAMGCYRTYSGNGFRILLRYVRPEGCTLTVTELHRLSLTKAMEHFDALLHLSADRQCLDMTRLCGLAHDERAYFNWQAEPVVVTAAEMDLYFKNVVCKQAALDGEQQAIQQQPSQQKKASQTKQAPQKQHTKASKSQPSYAASADTDAIISKVQELSKSWFIQFEPGSHHNFIMRFTQFCHHYGADKEDLLTWLLAEYGSQYKDIASIVDWVYNLTQEFGIWHLYARGEGYGRSPGVKVILQWLASKYELRFNCVTNQNELQALDTQHDQFYMWTGIDEKVENTLYCYMDMDGLHTTVKKIRAVINSKFTREYNPLEEYLKGLPEWHEGDPDYIKQLSDRIVVKDNPDYYHTKHYFEYAFRKWFVGMVASWCSKDSVNELVLILVGKGGIYKTKFFESLLPRFLRRYYANDSNADYANKDFQQTCSSKGLICLDEFDAPRGKNLSAFKSCVTKHYHTMRIPYDRYPSELLHYATLCATSNNLHIIGDEEDRRCLVWEVKEIANPYDNPIDYDHVYAQAVALIRKVKAQRAKGKTEGEWVYWLTREDHEKQNIHNRMFMINTYLEERILKFYRTPVKGSSDDTAPNLKFVTASDILDRICTNAVFRIAFSNSDIANVMNRLGFHKVHRKVGNGWTVIEKEGYDIAQESKITNADQPEEDGS